MFFCGSSAVAAERSGSGPRPKQSGPRPSRGPRAPPAPAACANVAYGTHERQVLDFYKAKSAAHAAAVLHPRRRLGRGRQVGRQRVKQYLAAGISVVSINYRYVTQAIAAGHEAAGEGPLQDAARALQFVRSKAAEWNIDKQRIGASGGSAGACSSLWLAFHEDMADPKSADPVAHESTRLWSAAVITPQTSLDPQQMKEWTPNSRYGGHAFGFMRPEGTQDARQQFANSCRTAKVLPWIKEYSPIELVTADDPPDLLDLLARAGAGPGPEGPHPHGQLRRETPGKVQEPGRGVRTGLSRRTRCEASPSLQDFLSQRSKRHKICVVRATATGCQVGQGLDEFFFLCAFATE